jgi:hypothetical protein
VIILVAPLQNEAWDRVVAALAADPALLAAVLDGELPGALVANGADAFEPSLGELRWECGCRRGHDRCAHVRAVWREALEALRREPALVLTLRGRDALSLAADASSLAALAAQGRDPGVDAAAAYERAAGGLPPLPDVRIPPAASRPDSWLEPDVLSGQRLLDQAADAAGRALGILQGAGDGGLDLDRQSDLARMGAALASPWDVGHLAWRAGISPDAFRQLVLAWEAHGGRGPLAAVRARQRQVVIAVAPKAGPTLEQLSLFEVQVGG